MNRSLPLLQRLEKRGIRLGLDPMHKVLSKLGGPEEELSVVLVGGTNGKGSTASILASVVMGSGYSVGLFTSPHLVTACERLAVDGEAISDGELFDLLTEIVEVAEEATGAPPTHFEALTVAALLYFRRAGVDLAILEVGLGGRLDATNCTHPILSLLTSFSLEHQQYLGDSLAEIVQEKAGILRPGQPAFAWTEDPEVRVTLRGVAQETRSRLRFLPDPAYSFRVTPRGWDGQELLVETPQVSVQSTLPLLGDHQARNAVLAVVGAVELRELGWQGITAEAIEEGIRRCRWPGRLELLQRDDGTWLLLDGAHNPGAAAALAAFIRTRDEEFDLVFGALEDKDAAGMLAVLEPEVGAILLTAPTSSRALSPEILSQALQPGRALEVLPARAALERSLEGRRTLVTGSLYLVGEVRALAPSLGFRVS